MQEGEAHDKLRRQLSQLRASLAEEERRGRALQEENAGLRQQVSTLKEAFEITSTAPASSPSSNDEEGENAFASDLRKELDEERDARQAQEAKGAELEGKLAQQQAEFEELTEKVKTSARKKAQAQSQLASVEAELRGIKTKVEELNNEVETLRPRVKDLEAELKEKTEEAERLRCEAVDFQSEKESFAKNLDELRERESATNLELDSLKAAALDFERLKQDMEVKLRESEARTEEQAVEHKIASKRSVNLIKDLKAQLLKEKQAHTEQEEALAQKDEEIESLRTDLSKMQAERDDLREEVSSVKAALEEANSKKPHTSFAGLMKKKRTASAEQPKQKLKLSENGVEKALAERLELLLQENQALKEKISILETGVQSYAEEMHDLKTKLKNSQSKRFVTAKNETKDTELSI